MFEVAMVLTDREALVAEITPLCTFPEIAFALNARADVPVAGTVFEKVERKDRVVRPLTAWQRGEEIVGQGWSFRIRFWSPGYGWAGRDFFRALDLLHLGHLIGVERQSGGRGFYYAGIMFADDFPSMWLAEKLTQGMTFGEDE